LVEKKQTEIKACREVRHMGGSHIGSKKQTGIKSPYRQARNIKDK
jgi:hypothetical protein